MRGEKRRKGAANVAIMALVALTTGCGAGDRAETASDGATANGAALDATAARKAVLDLYLTRQEYIELYYGPGGHVAAPEAVGETVERAEQRFHELMQLLGETPSSSDRVERAVVALTTAHEEVLEAARAADVPLTPSDRPVEGTPEGGLERWIADVRGGLESTFGGYDGPAATES